MSKYIDLNEATDLFKGIDATMTGGWVADTLEALPTIDIVHCKDCKFNKKCTLQHYWTVDGFTEEIEYCSLGKRSEK